MWPKKNTAFIVIHGSGEQRPFETLDKFARGFWNVLQKDNPNATWEHKLLQHDGWTENYVSLKKPDGVCLDFFEYYWDCYMSHETTPQEAVKWLERISDGAKQFYNENPEIREKLMDPNVHLKIKRYIKTKDEQINGKKTKTVQRVNYQPLLLGQTWWLKWLPPILNFVTNKFVLTILAPIFFLIMLDSLKDVVIYNSSDVRSQNYVIRQQIINGLVDEIKLLFEKEPDYQIVLAGHSLGSLIAYDVLNRINLGMNTGEISRELAPLISGLVTFGSPLDKAYFFFQEPKTQDQCVQRQILEHFHGYKQMKEKYQAKNNASPINDIANPITPAKNDKNPIDDISNPIEQFLDNSTWLNFYHPNDPASDYLTVYHAENIECTKDPEKAHESYFNNDEMYIKIAKSPIFTSS